MILHDGFCLKSDAKVKIILMGGQFLNSAPTFENVSVYASERQRLVDLFSESSGIPIILSGDRHHGEISKLLATNGNPFMMLQLLH